MTFTFPIEKEDFTAENGITYSWANTHWRVKAFNSPDGQTVIVDEDPPEGSKVGQLWFCSKSDDLTLYIFDGENWIPASPPVSLDGIEGDVKDLQGYIDTNITPALAGAVGDIRALEAGGYKLQDDIAQNQQNIITLQEEIEQLAPSFERGIWRHGGGNKPQKGEYVLQRFFTYEQLTQNCNQTYAECIEKCAAGDATCMGNCNRALDLCIAQYDDYKPTDDDPVGGTYGTTTSWEDAARVLFHTEDSKGTGHAFADVEVGMLLDIFNVSNDGFFVSQIKANCGIGDDVQCFDIDRVQSRGVPSGEAAIKFFTIEDGVDITNYVRKSGDTMTGPLWIHQGINGAKGKGNCLVVNQDPSKTGSIARFQQDGTDVLKINAQGQLECSNNRITQVHDPETGTDAINLRTFEQRGREDFVIKDGDTMTGQLIINSPRENVATNSFIIKGNIGGKEGQTMLKDYRDKKDIDKDSGIMYYGRTTADEHITTKKWVTGFVKDEIDKKIPEVEAPHMGLGCKWNYKKGKSANTGEFAYDSPFVCIHYKPSYSKQGIDFKYMVENRDSTAYDNWSNLTVYTMENGIYKIVHFYTMKKIRWGYPTNNIQLEYKAKWSNGSGGVQDGSTYYLHLTGVF